MVVLRTLDVLQSADVLVREVCQRESHVVAQLHGEGVALVSIDVFGANFGSQAWGKRG